MDEQDMKRVISTIFTPMMLCLAVLAAASVGCGELADPPQESLETQPGPTRTAEQSLDFRQGFDFERAAPLVRTVQRCSDCQKIRILHVKSDGADESDDNQKDAKSSRFAVDVADGNPVPFPLDEKKPIFD